MKYMIETWGCQMNSHDSEKIDGLLTNHGHMSTNNIKEAELIILNTCSIREKAVNKIYTRLGYLKKIKNQHPIIIGVVGCLAQQENYHLLQKSPHIDFVLGTRAIKQLPSVIQQIDVKKKKQIVDVQMHTNHISLLPNLIRINQASPRAMITITEGCNNHCTYCIVPQTRGPEIHKPFQDIFDEVQHHVKQGFQEIELLGQNVNSYQGGCSFKDLINKITAIEGLEWIRFMTNHPKNFTYDLAETIINNSKIAPFIHLPIQSGSNKILKCMNRGYTTEQYLECISYLNRKKNTDICLSTDFIIGFPGETEEDFRNTIDLMNNIQFDVSFSFIYSPRPDTIAATLKDTTPHNVKIERLKILKDRQNELSLISNNKMIGQRIKVRIETNSQTKHGYWLARTMNRKTVHIHTLPNQLLPFRKLVEVDIISASPHFLHAQLVQNNNTYSGGE